MVSRQADRRFARPRMGDLHDNLPGSHDLARFGQRLDHRPIGVRDQGRVPGFRLARPSAGPAPRPGAPLQRPPPPLPRRPPTPRLRPTAISDDALFVSHSLDQAGLCGGDIACLCRDGMLVVRGIDPHERVPAWTVWPVSTRRSMTLPPTRKPRSLWTLAAMVPVKARSAGDAGCTDTIRTSGSAVLGSNSALSQALTKRPKQ